MSDSSAAIGLASASSALPPPNSSASRLLTNDQVTPTRPRAARAWLGAVLDRRQHALARMGAARNGVGGT